MGYTLDKTFTQKFTVALDSADIERTVYYTMNSVTPDTPAVPGNPTPHDDVPENPGNDVPAKVNNVEPGTPVHPVNETSQKTNSQVQQARLPQTGNSESGLVGLGFVAIMTTLGFGFRKKKNN